MKRIRYVPVVLLSSAIFAACSERPNEPFAPITPDPTESVRPLMMQGADQDALARSVPGFGGMFYDAQGRATVYLTDVSQAAQARRALLQQARENAVLPSEIVVLQGAHKYDDLKKERNLAVLYITHDLATARHFSTQIVVLRHGRVVERGPSSDVLLNPVHPYTQLLVRAAPDPHSEAFVVDPDRYLGVAGVVVTESDPGPDSGGHWARAWAGDAAVDELLATLR